MGIRIERPVRSLDGVRDAGRFQVFAEHVSGVIEPHPRPHGYTGGLACKVVAQRVRYVERERLLARTRAGGKGESKCTRTTDVHGRPGR